jgi:hypothetical protein
VALPLISGRELVKALEKVGYILDRKGLAIWSCGTAPRLTAALPSPTTRKSRRGRFAQFLSTPASRLRNWRGFSGKNIDPGAEISLLLPNQPHRATEYPKTQPMVVYC